MPSRTSSCPPRTALNWTALTELAPISRPTVSLTFPNPNIAESFNEGNLRTQPHVHTLPLNDNLLICQAEKTHWSLLTHLGDAGSLARATTTARDCPPNSPPHKRLPPRA